MIKKTLIIFTIAFSLVLTGCTNSSNIEEKNMNSTDSSKTAVIRTEKGDISIELYPDAAPKTVENFAKKTSEDFYNGLIFHRVEDWVIQGGDPDGNGTGGGNQPTELSDKPFVEGAVGIARGGNIEISNDSQFFICTEDCSFLNGQYTIFGQVTSGMDVVKKIQIGDKIKEIEVSGK